MIEDQLVASQYQLVRRLGGGGMGEVWAALRLSDLEMVAVKFIRPELVTDRKLLIRFMREAIAAAEAQRSDHIIKVFDAGQAIELGAFDPPAEFWEFVEMDEEAGE